MRFLRKNLVLHLDVDLYKPTLDGLEFFYPRLKKNEVIIVDYGFSQFSDYPYNLLQTIYNYYSLLIDDILQKKGNLQLQYRALCLALKLNQLHHAQSSILANFLNLLN
jgi:hypothetical protein